MTDTIAIMELVWADKLTPGSLMDGDLIKVNGDVVEVISIGSDATGDNYFLEIIDAFGERDEVTIAHDCYVDLFVYVDSE